MNVVRHEWLVSVRGSVVEAVARARRTHAAAVVVGVGVPRCGKYCQCTIKVRLAGHDGGDLANSHKTDIFAVNGDNAVTWCNLLSQRTTCADA